MNARSLVKNKLLLKKVSEYFAKHPEKNSVTLRANLGEQEVFWKAVRENNDFAIVEVKTETKTFNIKNSVTEAASPAFADVSRAFMDLLSKPYQHSDVENSKRIIKTKVLQIKAPDEQERANNMLSYLNNLSSRAQKPASKMSEPMAGEGKKKSKKFVTGAPPSAKLTQEAGEKKQKKKKLNLRSQINKTGNR